MLDRLTIERDKLLREKKLKSDEPASYYDGVLDMANAVKKILEEKDADKGFNLFGPRRDSKD